MAKLIVSTDEVCDIDEASILLKKGVATVWRWIRDKKITAIKISGRTFIPRSEIERLTKEPE